MLLCLMHTLTCNDVHIHTFVHASIHVHVYLWVCLKCVSETFHAFVNKGLN